MASQSVTAAATIERSVPVYRLRTLLAFMVAVAGGSLAAAVALPAWLPGLSASLLGAEPKAYWYLSRATALVAYVLLWLSMMFSLAITSRVSRLWPGGPAAFDLHQHTSLLGLGFALFHALILLGDRYIGYTLKTVLVPFAHGAAQQTYRPGWVGLGQVSIYLLLIVGLSFYVRGSIGRRAWRLIHFLSFATFLLVLLHGSGSSTDSAAVWAKALYWGTGGSVLLLTMFRLLLAVGAR